MELKDTGTTGTLAAVRRDVVACARCARLRTYCERIATEKRAAYRDETYWAKPVPGSGDPAARIVIVGLAPAAHGANRTGRMFTGDGAGGSGDFLATALHATGLASQPFSRDAGDGQTLTDTWILAAVRCAPPDNKPTPEEIAHCHTHFRAEVDALPRARVLVALGRIAFDACLRLLAERGPFADASPGICPRRGVFLRSRRDAHRVLPSEPAEHKHRKADTGHAARNIPESTRDPGPERRLRSWA